MNPTFSIFVVATLLVVPTSTEAARGPQASNRNLALPPIPQISTAPPQTNPIGGVNQSFGVVPGFAETNPWLRRLRLGVFDIWNCRFPEN